MIYTSLFSYPPFPLRTEKWERLQSRLPLPFPLFPWEKPPSLFRFLQLRRHHHQKRETLKKYRPLPRKKSVDPTFPPPVQFLVETEHCTPLALKSGTFLTLISISSFLQVSWVHRSPSDGSPDLLTLGNSTHTLDDRVSLRFSHPGNWALRITGLRPADAGAYLCQVKSNFAHTKPYFQ